MAPPILKFSKLYTVHTVHFHFFFTIKSVRHVSVLYYGTIIRDLYIELHKITKQPVVVHIKG
jgi:hypothetical protein